MITGKKALVLSNQFKIAARGSLWTLIGYGSSQVLRAGSTVLLARLLLGPKEFGLVALVTVFLSGLEMLSDLGIGIDVIQHRRGDEQEFINTAFWIQVVRGLILWAVATALAYPFAKFYRAPDAFGLSVVAAISTGLRGFTSGSVWQMRRHTQLRELTFLTVCSELASFFVSVIWAAVAPSAWALVMGRVAGTVVFVVSTHIVSKHNVAKQWDARAAKEIIRFGGGILLSTATYFLVGEAERLIIGKFVTLAELGCFSLALTLSSAATSGPQQIISQVFFPMMSKKVRQGATEAQFRYRQIRKGLLAVCVVLLGAFIAGGPWLVPLILGRKYLMTGWMVQLLGFRAVFEMYTALATVLLFTAGTSRYAAAGNFARMLFLAAGLPVAFLRFGLVQAVWVLALSPIPAYIPLLIGLRRHFPSVAYTELSCAAVFGSAALLFAMAHRLV